MNLTRADKVFLGALLILLVPSTYCQDLESISWKKGIQVGGSVTLNSILFASSRINNSRTPFTYFATGNLSFNLFGIDAPFSYSYSNTGTALSQPFNQVRINPKYKWAKASFGYQAMNFSQYTLSGHVFSGVGLELTPGKWQLSLMGGRLRKSVPFSTSDTSGIQASFKRMGYGMKIGFSNNSDMYELSVFAAKDDIKSIPSISPQSSLAPESNLSSAVNIRKRISSRISAEICYAFSLLNSDLRTVSDSTASRQSGSLQSLVPSSQTEKHFDAITISSTYSSKTFSIQTRYERVAPEYKTLGAYYFNNDFENITIGPTFRLLKNLMIVNLNVGLQRNNLDAKRTSTTKRTITTGNLLFIPKPQWTVSINYSNLSSFTNQRPITPLNNINPLDSLNFYQISRNLILNGIYLFGTKEILRTISLSINSVRTSDRRENSSNSQQSSDVSTFNLAYSHRIGPKKAIGCGTQLISMRAQNFTSLAWGPNIELQGLIFKENIQTTISISYNEQRVGGSNSSVVNTRATLALAHKNEKDTPSSPHQVSTSLNLTNSLGSISSEHRFSELTISATYTYKF